MPPSASPGSAVSILDTFRSLLLLKEKLSEGPLTPSQQPLGACAVAEQAVVCGKPLHASWRGKGTSRARPGFTRHHVSGTEGLRWHWAVGLRTRKLLAAPQELTVRCVGRWGSQVPQGVVHVVGMGGTGRWPG